MAWHIYEALGLVETYPDDEDHGHEVIERDGELYIICGCQPRVSREKNVWLILHNSFDGREGVEWVNEILKEK